MYIYIRYIKRMCVYICTLQRKCEYEYGLYHCIHVYAYTHIHTYTHTQILFLTRQVKRKRMCVFVCTLYKEDVCICMYIVKEVMKYSRSLDPSSHTLSDCIIVYTYTHIPLSD